MGTMKKITIILPVRNGGELVKECVQSILSQTYSDFDFIILDNHSDDGTYEWISSITDNRIKIFRSAETLSMPQKMNGLPLLAMMIFCTRVTCR